MTQVTAVDPYWLGTAFNYYFYQFAIADTCIAELGSVFYSVREKNFDDRGARRQADREFSKRAELETEMAKQREAYVKYALLGQFVGTKCFVVPQGRPKRTPSPSKLVHQQHGLRYLERHVIRVWVPGRE